ncbi:MAG: hypothetical protein PHP42_06990 [Bacteroidota bacterium]|nr:hypothetical protein [Bacteroidota bacterium]
MNTKNRPITVTIISWFLIITSGITLLYLPFSVNNPISAKIFESYGVSKVTVVLYSIAGIAINLTSGIAMLKRKGWGAKLYFYITPVVLLASAMLYNFKMLGMQVWGVAVYVTFLILLTRRAATEYFSDDVSISEEPTEPAVQNEAEQTSTGRKVGAVILLIIGGLLLNGLLSIIVPLSSSLAALIITCVILGVMGLAFIIPAIFLWGRKKWAILLGTLFTIMGGTLLLTGIMLYQFISTPEYKVLFAQLDPAMLGDMVKSSIVCGIGIGIVGVILLLFQRARNKG